MTKDDKLLRDTILAELKRRRGLLGKDEERPRSDAATPRPLVRPISPPYPPSPPAGTTSE